MPWKSQNVWSVSYSNEAISWMGAQHSKDKGLNAKFPVPPCIPRQNHHESRSTVGLGELWGEWHICRLGLWYTLPLKGPKLLHLEPCQPSSQVPLLWLFICIPFHIPLNELVKCIVWVLQAEVMKTVQCSYVWLSIQKLRWQYRLVTHMEYRQSRGLTS